MALLRFHQQQKWASLERFLGQKTPHLHFLGLCLLFAILLLVFGTPTTLLTHTTQNTTLNPLLQVAISTIAGIAAIGISHWILYRYCQKRVPTNGSMLLWIVIEQVGSVAVMALTLWGVSGGGPVQLTALCINLLFQLLAIEAIPFVISLLMFRLREEHGEVMRLQELLSQHGFSSDTNSPLLSERVVNFYDKGNRLAFSTSIQNILYVEAAVNYVNIHYRSSGHEEAFILHNTLKEVENRLGGLPMQRCHRSYIVNINNVRLLRKEGPQLLLELDGTSRVLPVTKTYAPEVTSLIASEK